MNTYSKIEKILLSQGKFHISLELERITTTLELLNNPQNNLKIIHVAGTNGKGSTCAMLNQILIEQGYKTGFYSSPHLVRYNERIKINNKPISDKKLYKLIKLITDISEKNGITLTEFEILTAVMYKYFSDEKVDYCVVEVGLGGRFDATNVISSSLITIITSISKDHSERLGNKIEQIAFEKGGIIKENCDVIFDKNNLGFKVLEEISTKKQAKIHYPEKAKLEFLNDKNIIKYNAETYELGLWGKYQAENVSLVLCTIYVLKQKGINFDKRKIKNGLKTVKWEGRFEYLKDKNLIIDGCHNPDGAKKLKESLDFYFPDKKRIFLYTNLKNKDFKSVQENLFTANDKIIFFDTKSDRFIESKDVEKPHKTVTLQEISKLINQKRENELLIICGSLYAIGDILGKIELCNS